MPSAESRLKASGDVVMKPGVCKRHDAQRFVLTSPRLAVAISNQILSPLNIFIIRVDCSGSDFEFLVDCEFPEKYGISSGESVIGLKDRDKLAKQLNDRLIIQKMVRDMKWVCPLCLHMVARSPV